MNVCVVIPYPSICNMIYKTMTNLAKHQLTFHPRTNIKGYKVYSFLVGCVLKLNMYVIGIYLFMCILSMFSKYVK